MKRIFITIVILIIVFNNVSYAEFEMQYEELPQTAPILISDNGTNEVNGIFFCNTARRTIQTDNKCKR